MKYVPMGVKIRNRLSTFVFISLLISCKNSSESRSEGPEQAGEGGDGATEVDQNEEDGQGVQSAAATNADVKDKPLLAECYKGDAFSCAVEAVIVRETNGVRGSRTPLRQSFEDSFVARRWSQQQASIGNLSHDGFPYERKRVLTSDFPRATWSYLAENVAFLSEGDTSAEAVGIRIVKNWRNSEGHLRNMLGNYRYIGVGVVRKDNSLYATQIFH
jgi:uncharacterized protein YkwD